MGRARQKKRRNRYVQSVVGERMQDLSGKQGVKRLMELGEQAFRADVAAMRDDIVRAAGDDGDRLAPGWTPLFERFRRERMASLRAEQARLRGGTSQAIELLPMLDRASATATVHAGMQLVRTYLERTALFLLTASAFAMSAYLLVRDARLSDALLPPAPVWIEYDRPRRMRADLPDYQTSGFWFSNPFQVETVLSAFQRGHLAPETRRLAASVSTAREREAWLLEVYSVERGAIAVLQYHVPSATWEYALGHENVCPHKLCISEKLERGGGFIVACEGCRAALATYSRVFATSLLITSGALRASVAGEDSQPPEGSAPNAFAPREQACEDPEEQTHAGERAPQEEGDAAAASGDGSQAPAAVEPNRPPQTRATRNGYTVIEFDASVRPRARPKSRTRCAHWSEGREIIDLAEQNALDIEIDPQAVVLVDLSFSGITRELRSDYFRHKKGQVIEVSDYSVPVKMTYAAYKRRLENRRITKVTATRFRGLVATPTLRP